jgi:hypothetical protein
MTSPNEMSFDDFLDTVFASSRWLDACVDLLSAFLEELDSCRDNPRESLPESGSSIVEHVAAVADRAERLQLQLRETAERRGPAFQTSELGAVLWWVGMALHKASGSVESARDKMAYHAWEEAFIEVHALLYDTMAGISLLSVAQALIERMESEGVDRARPN